MNRARAQRSGARAQRSGARVEHLPRGRAYLAEQLQRASTSIPLNTAEGAGEFSTKEKARFYRNDSGRELLLRIVSMLIKMARNLD